MEDNIIKPTDVLLFCKLLHNARGFDGCDKKRDADIPKLPKI